MLMWQVCFLIAKARPWARGRKRFRDGPMSAMASLITKVAGSRPMLCSAFATADRYTLVMGPVDRYGMNSSMISASR